MDVGKALNTKISADVGEIIRVKVDEVKAQAIDSQFSQQRLLRFLKLNNLIN